MEESSKYSLLGFNEQNKDWEYNLRRNKPSKSYSPEIAHKLYCSRRKSNNCKLTDEVKKLIIALLKKKISPELICAWGYS